MDKNQLVLDTLERKVNSLSFAFHLTLKARYSEKYLLETSDSDFRIRDFAKHENCKAQFRSDFLNPVDWVYEEDENTDNLYPSITQGWYTVEWDGSTFEVVHLTFEQGRSSTTIHWIIAESEAVATGFMLAVCRWNTTLREEVLVFQDGCWSKDEELYHSIQNATFDNLILPATLMEEIRADMEQFLASRTLFERYSIPWKRGMLLVGPPGNGKTHCIKALINWLNIPSLYVKSFKEQYTTDHATIQSVFKKARKTTPCLLIMEDLDSLIDAKNRSFFLNELDGFAANTGIILIATTNHPERLDPAIVDRPSRFDRKYHFHLPEMQERVAYVRSWQVRLDPDMQLTEVGLQSVAEATEGFSFAYLKELLLSAIMHWVNFPTPGTMDTVMRKQCDLLRGQMSSMNLLYEHQPTEDASED